MIDDLTKLERLAAFLDDDAPTVDVNAHRAEVNNAWLTAQKLRFRGLREQIDRERCRPRPYTTSDREAVHRLLRELAANDDAIALTLAARGGVDALGDDLGSVLDDLAELLHDIEQPGE